MIEFSKQDLPDEHERVGDGVMDEMELHETHTWHIYLCGKQDIRRESFELLGDAFNRDLATTLIPEQASIEMVSFYFEGTYKEARIAGEVMADKLNQLENVEKNWWTGRDQTMLIEEESIDTNPGP